MAEYVQARMEETIPELEQMERIQIFQKHEIKAIAGKRKEFEYKIQRLTKCKEDYLRYIQYEMDLLKLIKIRREKSRMFIKRKEIEHTITNRVDKLFKQVIQRFQSDVKLWISHIKFCREVGFTSAISAIFVRMLAVHSDKPNVWKFAANWEFEKSDSIENARSFLLRGLRFHPDSKLLYKEAIRTELRFVEQQLAAKDEKEEEERAYTNKVKKEKTEDPVMQGRLAEVFFESAVDKVDDVHFYIELLNIANEFDFAKGLQHKIVNHLLSVYRKDEHIWDLMGRRELAGYSLNHKHISEIPVAQIPEEDVNVKEERSLKDNIHMCVCVYQEALKTLPTEQMWTFYIEVLIELNQDPFELPKYKEQLLLTALEEAHAAGLLKQTYYEQWMDFIESKDLDNDVEAVLEKATERFPENVGLWRRYLGCYLHDDDDKQALALFNKAVAKLGAKNEDTLPLWTDFIQYYQEKDVAEAESVFERALGLGTSISMALKPIYLDWLHVVKGMDAVRSKYVSLCLLPPLCLDLHVKMIELEMSQATVEAKRVRKCYDMASHQFGKNNYELWLDYVKFELSKGEAKNVSGVYDRAIKALEEGQLESFISKYSLMKSGVLV